MNWQNYLRGLVFSTLLFGGILIFLNIATSPEAGPLTVFIYLASLFIFLMGLFSIIGFVIRRWRNHNEMLFENVKVSLRQGFLISCFGVSLLLLNSLRLLNWIDGIIIAVSFILLEMYFNTKS